MRCALRLAFDKAGRSIAARMAMMAMTTSSSISVKATRAWKPLTRRASLGRSNRRLMPFSSYERVPMDAPHSNEFAPRQCYSTI